MRNKKFWRRESFTISDTPKGLRAFQKYEVTDRLDKLRELCENYSDAIKDVKIE